MNGVLRALRVRAARAWSEFLVSDPGSVRWLVACRTTLAVALATTLLGFLAAQGWVPLLAPAVGVTFCAMSGAFPRESTRRAQRLTLGATALASAAATTAAALASEIPFAGDALFVATLVVAVAFQVYGPRAVVCGFVAVIDIYLVLFLRAGPQQIVPTLLTLPLAVLVVALVTFVVIPEKPERVLRRIVRSVEVRGAGIVRAIASGPSGDAGTLRRRHLFATLNEAVLAAEDQVAAYWPVGAVSLSITLMRFELALVDLSAAAPAGQALARAEQARLRLAALRLYTGRRSEPVRPHEAGASAVIDAVQRLETVAGTITAAIPAMPEVAALPGASASATRPALAWRPALRAALAAALSMIGGYALSPDRWFWATLTVYILFLGARSRGDTVQKGVQRVGGTLIGLVAGVAVSFALAGHLPLQIIAALVSVFAMTYVFAVSPTLAIFCVTVLLGIIYSLLGYQTQTILFLRLEETAIGAVAAAVVGLLVFPQRTSDAVTETASKLLARSADTLRLGCRRLAGEVAQSPVSAMRQADRILRDLRIILRPLRAQSSLVWWARGGTDLPAVLLLVTWLRAFATACESETGRDASAALIARVESLAGALDRLAKAEHDHRAPAMEPAAPAAVASLGTSQLSTIVESLEQTVDLLRVRLAAEGWSALAARRPL